MTKTERLYRRRLAKIVKARIDAEQDEDAPPDTLLSLGRACFPRSEGQDFYAWGQAARRRLEREMGFDPSGRTSDGLKWETLDAICAGLGCTRGDLLG